MAKSSKGTKPTIVIRREEVVEGGHHGGAWKVAYADFVTAMMAFFLLMWLLNATTEEQRKGLADYFTPSNLMSHSASGSGQPFGGHTAFDEGAMVSDRGAVQVEVGTAPVPLDPPDDEGDTPVTRSPAHQMVKDQPKRDGDQDAAADKGSEATAARSSDAREAAEQAAVASEIKPEPADPSSAAEKAKSEAKALEDAAQQLREGVKSDPGLAPFARQLTVDVTPEGLRIQILDEDHSPMFATGSATPNDRARMLLQKVTPVLAKLTEGISIAGHTDATPFKGGDRSNWELSVERANATRRLLLESGLAEERIRTVTGNADRDPLLPADPEAAANRRIAIVVLRNFPKPVTLTEAEPGPAVATAR